MTGYPEFNFPAFHAAAADLRRQGHEVVNPAEADYNPEPGSEGWATGENVQQSREWYLRRSLLLMLAKGCDGVVLLPGWRESKGARLEAHVAAELGWATFEYTPPR
jgi:hypothetical protein